MGFSQIEAGVFPKKTVDVAERVWHQSVRTNRELIQSALQDVACRKAELDFLLGLSRSKSANVHASNLLQRERLVKALMKTMLNTWSQGFERQLHFVTVTPDSWLLSERQPILQLRAMRKQAAKWLAVLDLTGLAFIEFAPFVKHPKATGDRLIAQHLHVIGYPANEQRLRDGVERLKAGKTMTCSLGLPVVVSKPIHLTEEDVAMVAGYCFKGLHKGKRAVRSRNDPGKYKLYDTPLPRRLALRTAEILSYLSFQDLVVSRGSAAWHWRQSLFGSLGEIGRRRITLRFDSVDLEGIWAAVWRAKGVEHYSPVRVNR